MKLIPGPSDVTLVWRIFSAFLKQLLKSFGLRRVSGFFPAFIIRPSHRLTWDISMPVKERELTEVYSCLLSKHQAQNNFFEILPFQLLLDKKWAWEGSWRGSLYSGQPVPFTGVTQWALLRGKWPWRRSPHASHLTSCNLAATAETSPCSKMTPGREERPSWLQRGTGNSNQMVLSCSAIS